MSLAVSGCHFDTEVLPQLLQEHEGKHGVGDETDARRNETLEKGLWSKLCCLHGTMENTLILALGVHQASLQHVQGLAEKCGTSALGRQFANGPWGMLKPSPHPYPQATLKEPFSPFLSVPGLKDLGLQEVRQELSWPGLTCELG